MDIFRIYEEIKLETIEDYIINKQEENLFLDFKTVKSANFVKEDIKTFAKALSGFADSSGGIIVWGVDARKNKENIDCANGKKEIENLPLFISRLNQLTGELVDPIVDGVVHRAIEVTKDRGFAVTLIPQSDSGPHMAKGGEDRYYKRSGDSFYKMEHFDIEDMFGRRKRPKLSLHKRIIRRSSASTKDGLIYQLVILLGIENIGRAPAKSPYFAVNVKEPYRIHGAGIDGHGSFGLKKLVRSSRSDEEKYGASANKVIHPGTSLDVTAIEVKVNLSNISEVKDVIIKYKIAAEDIRIVEDEVIVTREELIAEAERYFGEDSLIGS